MRPGFESDELSDRAGQMRKEHTRAEQAAWDLLGDRRTLGLKFRRQVSRYRYAVDSYCPEIRLIIEVDGGVHDRAGQVKWDEERNKRLLEPGYKILQVPIEDVNVLDGL